MARTTRRVDSGSGRRGFQAAVEQAKLDALKELAYGAAHEINNPLASIAVHAETLLKEEEDPERRRRLAAIHTQAFRAHEMIADLMLFARPPALQRERQDVVALLTRVIDEMRWQAEELQVELEWKSPSRAIELEIDSDQIGVAIRAVCQNAMEAVGEGGCVTVSLGARPDKQGMHQIVVQDDGPGIPANVRQHVFDPFYSGREAGRGLGFGLSKCWRIITDHGGEVGITCPRGGGTRTTLRLPAVTN